MAAAMTRRHRLRRAWRLLPAGWRRSRVLLVAIAGLGIAYLAGSVITAQLGQTTAKQETAVVEDQRDAAGAQAAGLAQQIQAACGKGELTGPVCTQANQVAAEPVPGPAGPAPTPEQIKGAVDTYMAQNPPPAGRAPTAAEVAAAVAGYLSGNPPTPGRPPTAAEIADAVQVYFATNPPPQGVRGEPGRPPTADEIRSAVDAHLAANPPPAGATGAQGVGVSAVRTEERDGSCLLIFTLTNPSDGSSTEQEIPVGSAVCGSGGLFG